MRRRATALVTVAVAAAALLGACGSEPEPSSEVTVSGEPGELPELTYETPLELEGASAEAVWEGDGPQVEDGSPILVHYYAESGTDGSVIGETYSGEPTPFLLSPEALGADIFAALSGRTVGSRIVHTVPASDDQEMPTVAVFDLLPTRASGDAVEPREGLPTVTLGPDGSPSVTIPDTEPPAELVVQPLIKGAGRQVEAGQIITVQYTGLTWSDGEVFDSSWAAGKLPTSFPIGVQSVVEAWDIGLVEQTVGSQVLLVVPPELGYGGDTDLADETLVFVVDLLAASGGPTS